jgi:pimeloyl-ACP methyl ester carboxylesterase
MRIFATRYRSDVAGLILVDPAHPEDWVNPAAKEQVKIDRGVRLCAHGAAAARFGLARVVGALAEMGAVPVARTLAQAVGRGALSREDEGLLAPLWKLPPVARRPLRHFWAQAKFYESLRSHIESIGISAAETLAAAAGGYGSLPLVTISSTDPGEYRLRQQEALARLSTRGRHVVATNSGHWIPLDQPAVVIEAIESLLAELGSIRFVD